MSTVIRNYSGKATMDDLVRACRNTQGPEKAKLVHLQGGIDEAAPADDKFFNQAQFAKVQLRSQIYDELIFVAVDDESKVPSIIAEKLAEKALLIFNETLIVEGKEQRTLGFGKFN